MISLNNKKLVSMKEYFFRRCLFFFLVSFFLVSCGSKKMITEYTEKREHPKREFRGAWIQTAWQTRYQSMNSFQMKNYFIDLLNKLQAAGINAVIFQIRPQADAFYYSELEPWSSFLTGTQGRGLADGFDPLDFMIKECHKRNMELHAWMNPYRVKMSENQVLTRNHIYNREPNRFVKYGTQIFFDPGIPKNRAFICQIVEDIVKRYNVDAIHMDDYFYPYPIPGVSFPDNASFFQYGVNEGFSESQRDDWRRNNVNMLVKEIKETIVRTKPWVRFGISPFGIYRNKKNTPDGSGSETNGLENYGDLYADVKLWVKNGWIDYNMPQIYWELGHKSADYTTLITWWAKNNYKQPLYIGQDVTRTMDAPSYGQNNQLADKIIAERSNTLIQGNCFWSGYNIAENYKGIADELIARYHKYPALIPAYTNMSKHTPQKVQEIQELYTKDSHYLTWKAKDVYEPGGANYFVVYRFEGGAKEDLDDVRNIVAITRDNKLLLPYEGQQRKYKYVITAVNVFHNESKGKSKNIKL